MPRKEKKTKEEQEDEWRKAAHELNLLGLLESKHPAFLRAYRKKHMDDWAVDAELMLHVDHVYNIICGVGSPAKLRTRFMDCMMPIPNEAIPFQYSRMGKPENAGGFWLALGFDKIINDHSYYADAIKEAEGGGMYLQLPGMVLPEGEGACKYMHPYTEALRTYFHKHIPREHYETPLVAIKCRLYMQKSGTGPLAGDWTSRAAMIDALTGIKDKIEAVEALRAELCELSGWLHPVLKENLQAFDVDADNDSGSDSDGETRSKKQKTTCKRESVQKIHVSTIEVVGAKGVNDPRYARRKDFMGETDAHVVELMMGLFLCDDDDYEAAHKYLPMAQAPRYSDGAELRVRGTRHTFAQPGDFVESSTVITQRWATMHGPQQRKEQMDMYLKAHDQAAEVRAMTRDLVKTLRETFSLSLCFEGLSNGELIFELRDDPYLTLLEKKALFNVFMANIWQPVEAAEEEEEEEESEEEESDQEDDEYDGEEGSDEEEVESSDDDDDASDDDEDASEGSDSGSDDD